MTFIKDGVDETLEIKKSKFITYLMPYCDFHTSMKDLKIKYPKARHFVYSYRFLNEFDQIVENSSDDGEPKGTSGRPTLNVLSGAKMINTAVIVVRYFGGIRLGTGGLVKAYSDAVNLVLTKATIYTYEKLENRTLEIPYNSLGKIEYLLEQQKIKINNKDFDTNITLNIATTNENFAILDNKLPIGISTKNVETK